MDVTIKVKEKAFKQDDGWNIVLDDINLHIKEGHFLTIIGPSGCGKSTLLKIIAGLDTEYIGNVHIGGRSVDKPGISQGF